MANKYLTIINYYYSTTSQKNECSSPVLVAIAINLRIRVGRDTDAILYAHHSPTTNAYHTMINHMQLCCLSSRFDPAAPRRAAPHPE